MNDKLVSLMSDLMEDETIALVKDLIKQGTDPMSILDDARRAMEVVGKRFEKCEYFIPDLMMAGEILKGISDIVRPLMTGGQAAKKKGKVLIGTVAGDIHDIGKDIVTFMLDVSGYDVLDIGIDVPVATFVQKVKDFGPAVVGLSGFLTLAFDSMKKTVEALDQAGLRKNIKIMIGGGQMDDEIKKYVKADAYGKDAIAAVSLCKEWLGA
ncbi:MAG: cobalamin-dependent protein [Syntrophorhabdales bacterium]|jgi:5-methyltetrahydrofolate--homocysteine methyltransferase